MSHAKQATLNLYFFQAPKHKSAKVHVVFYIPEHRFDFNTALLAQGDALLGEQIVFSLLAITAQFKPLSHINPTFSQSAFSILHDE